MLDEDGELPIWVTSVADQMKAAERDGDYETLARIAIDGWITGFKEDAQAGYDIDFNHIQRAFQYLIPPAAYLMGAAAIHRLVQQALEGSP